MQILHEVLEEQMDLLTLQLEKAKLKTKNLTLNQQQKYAIEQKMFPAYCYAFVELNKRMHNNQALPGTIFTNLEKDIKSCMNIFYNFTIRRTHFLVDRMERLNFNTIDNRTCLALIHYVQYLLNDLDYFYGDFFTGRLMKYQRELVEDTNSYILSFNKEMKDNINNIAWHDIESKIKAVSIFKLYRRINKVDNEIYHKAVCFLEQETLRFYTDNSIGLAQKKEGKDCLMQMANSILFIPLLNAQSSLYKFNNMQKFLANKQTDPNYTELNLFYPFLLLRSYSFLREYHEDLFESKVLLVKSWIEDDNSVFNILPKAIINS